MTTAPPTGPPSAGTTPDAGPPPAARAVPAAKRHTARYAVVGLVLVGALAFLLAKGLGSALNYYLPADQAVAQKATLGVKTFNLEGVVAPGSIHSTTVPPLCKRMSAVPSPLKSPLPTTLNPAAPDVTMWPVW